jgi:hypothetical protein
VEKTLAQLGKTSEDSFDALFRKALAALAK